MNFMERVYRNLVRAFVKKEWKLRKKKLKQIQPKKSNKIN